MTDRQQSPQAPTEATQQTTMNQGQDAIEQAMDLQRNMAQMTLRAMQWQGTAQTQGFKMMTSMLQGMPGQQFTQLMMERYLAGLEAVMPELERALEKGVHVTSQPQSTRQGDQAGPQMGEQMPSAGGRQMSDQTQQRPLPAQTGEWVTQADSYGGEPSGSPPRQRFRQTSTERQSEPQPRHPRSEPGPQREQAVHETQSEQDKTQQSRQLPRQGERPPQRHQQRTDQPPSGRQQEQRKRGREFSQPPQRRRSVQPRSDRSRSRDESTQRINSEHSDRHQHRQQQSARQERSGHSEPTGSRRIRELERSGGSERGAGRDTEHDELSREDGDVSSESDRRPSGTEFADEDPSA